jgi:D-alanyl-D-alanine carboxypeptidase
MLSSWPLIVVIALSLGTAVVSPPSNATVVREAQKVLVRVRLDGPGAAMLIARGRQVIFRGARGRAEIELAVPLSPQRLPRIGV